MIDTPLSTSRILIIDDEPDNVALMELVLTSEGYTCVDGATSSLEALARHQATPYDLIVLDVHMPGMDGLCLLDRLGPDARVGLLPVLMVTADYDQKVRLAALERGARDFITKPVARVEFLARVRNLLEARCQVHRLRQSNRQLSSQVEIQAHRLEKSHMELLRHLGRAAEFRDNETSMHAVRMSEYAYELAIAAGMPPDEASQLRHACPMHDIGKIGVPDHILLKPGRLTAEEFEIIKQHPRIGGEILAGHTSEVVQLARVVALTHHERWDGKGYPAGLTGEAIPLVGRIAAVCDVFDALTSERPYKTPWTPEAALAEIERGAGTQFDPRLVAAFKGVEARIRELMTIYADPPASEATRPVAQAS